MMPDNDFQSRIKMRGASDVLITTSSKSRATRDVDRFSLRSFSSRSPWPVARIGSPNQLHQNNVPAACNQATLQHDLAGRFECLQEYGNFTMAFATLQPGMKYFESCGGYIAYDQYMGTAFVLGDPVGAPEYHELMIRDFLREHRSCFFCQISPKVGAILSSLGWYVNELGADMELDLPSYDFEGKKKAKLRQASRKMAREGFCIAELSDSEVDPWAIDSLCTSWLENKTVKREARFLVRPFHFGPEPGVRKFYLFNPNCELESFVVFDPLFEGNHVIGYSPAIKRRSPTAPVGAEEAITKYAIEKFQAEGFRTLKLGLLPLYEIGESEFGDAWPLRKFLQWLYRNGDRLIYSFRGHADFKHRYRGRLKKTYVASERKWGNAFYMFALMKICNIL